MAILRMGTVDNPPGQLFAYAFPNPFDTDMSSAGLDPGIDPKYYVIRYDDHDGSDLIDNLKNVLKNADWTNSAGQKVTGAVLRQLEISAHGSPTSLNAFSLYDPGPFTFFGMRLAKLNWSDEADIYLSGCNTGCRQWQHVESFAERLADLIPRKKNAFRCTVYGTVGYLSGAHAAGTSETDPVFGNYTTTYFWQRQGHLVDNDPDPHMRPYRGYRGPNSA